MDAIVIKHVGINELPESWRSRLTVPQGTRVRVLIEEETEESGETATAERDCAFGMWRDRDEVSNVEVYVQDLRAPRFARP